MAWREWPTPRSTEDRAIRKSVWANCIATFLPAVRLNRGGTQTPLLLRPFSDDASTTSVDDVILAAVSESPADASIDSVPAEPNDQDVVAEATSGKQSDSEQPEKKQEVGDANQQTDEISSGGEKQKQDASKSIRSSLDEAWRQHDRLHHLPLERAAMSPVFFAPQQWRQLRRLLVDMEIQAIGPTVTTAATLSTEVKQHAECLRLLADWAENGDALPNVESSTETIRQLMAATNRASIVTVPDSLNVLFGLAVDSTHAMFELVDYAQLFGQLLSIAPETVTSLGNEFDVLLAATKGFQDRLQSLEAAAQPWDDDETLLQMGRRVQEARNRLQRRVGNLIRDVDSARRAQVVGALLLTPLPTSEQRREAALAIARVNTTSDVRLPEHHPVNVSSVAPVSKTRWQQVAEQIRREFDLISVYDPSPPRSSEIVSSLLATTDDQASWNAVAEASRVLQTYYRDLPAQVSELAEAGRYRLGLHIDSRDAGRSLAAAAWSGLRVKPPRAP